MKRAAWLLVGVVGVLLVLGGGYFIWLGWHARSIGIFAVFVGLIALLMSYLYVPRKNVERAD